MNEKINKITIKNIKMPKRNKKGNKGSFGKLLFICGSKTISGAAFLSAKAAMRTGAGMVRIFTHKDNRTILATLLPEALITTYDEEIDVSELQTLYEWADAILIGPGIGTDKTALQLVKFVINNSEKPTVFDADALNLIAKNKLNVALMNADVVMTPHIIELSRLLGVDKDMLLENRILYMKKFAKENNLILVSKDYKTLIVDKNGNVFQNTTGNDGMGTAGSGDVLAGIITALLVSFNGLEASNCGVFLHGLAGDMAAAKLTKYSLIASDIIDEIPSAIKKIL